MNLANIMIKQLLANNMAMTIDDHKAYLPPDKPEWEFAEVTRDEIIIIIKSLKNIKKFRF